MNETLLFHIGYSGRFGYLILGLIALFSSIFLIIPYNKYQNISYWTLFIFFTFSVLNFSLFFYSITQACRISPRFIATGKSLKFNGLLTRVEIEWQDIIEYKSTNSLRFGLSSIKILYYDKGNKNRRCLYLDTNGIFPDNSQLYSTIAYFITRSRRLGQPRPVSEP
ncbi:hypothetical protein RO575_00520 [Methylomonas sp. MO1]|uniref:hypothetical protein n=1 Tax=Methylomonas sp. MO1 TaxID=3073619 RepID=UPI0028A4E25D|nr:hypothetical protein [Methylomonas sp. MO1]MDT4288035.1 hypothetical protein [Methylomonas sp. MO1]